MAAPKQIKPHTILKRHGLRARPVMVAGERMYVITALAPTHDPEILSLIGRWYSGFELTGLASNLAEKDALQRYERAAEREEQQQRRPRWLYYW